MQKKRGEFWKRKNGLTVTEFSLPYSDMNKYIRPVSRHASLRLSNKLISLPVRT